MLFGGYIWLSSQDKVTVWACSGHALIVPVSQNPTHQSHLKVFKFAVQAFGWQTDRLLALHWLLLFVALYDLVQSDSWKGRTNNMISHHQLEGDMTQRPEMSSVTFFWHAEKVARQYEHDAFSWFAGLKTCICFCTLHPSCKSSAWKPQNLTQRQH